MKFLLFVFFILHWLKKKKSGSRGVSKLKDVLKVQTFTLRKLKVKSKSPVCTYMHLYLPLMIEVLKYMSLFHSLSAHLTFNVRG